MFFQLKEAPKKTLDTYDKISELVCAILYFECTDHSANHHILYSANSKLESYREARDFYRPFDDPSTSLGQFSREAYQLANQKYNQLYTIIRGYMYLSDDTQREHFNHHFRFSKEKIDTFHALFSNKDHHKQLQLETSFYEHLKNDVAPLLTQFE
ncbi:hypothetical protein [Solibacillus daqui]|uniref:hypothetical protein n=1 Tax=Solibacillus daqui TaxID=2912187 RepID=UPI002366D003|nr:hypothetical protein [Solibacillus daqui]